MRNFQFVNIKIEKELEYWEYELGDTYENTHMR